MRGILRGPPLTGGLEYVIVYSDHLPHRCWILFQYVMSHCRRICLQVTSWYDSAFNPCPREQLCCADAQPFPPHQNTAQINRCEPPSIEHVFNSFQNVSELECFAWYASHVWTCCKVTVFLNCSTLYGWYLDSLPCLNCLNIVPGAHLSPFGQRKNMFGIRTRRYCEMGVDMSLHFAVCSGAWGLESGTLHRCNIVKKAGSLWISFDKCKRPNVYTNKDAVCYRSIPSPNSAIKIK